MKDEYRRIYAAVAAIPRGRVACYGEIAARLNCTEGAARTRVHRGLARLGRLMEASA